jgi:glucose/arabinose dehydrogenase
MIRTLTMFLATLLTLASSACGQTPSINLPSGFTISTFASGLGGARFMTLDSSGTLLVSVPSRGRVIALPANGARGTADAITVVEGLDRPHGLAWKDGNPYVAENGRVLRFHYDPTLRKADGSAVIVPNLPRGGSHFTRTGL